MFLTYEDLSVRFKRSKRTIQRDIKLKRFPTPNFRRGNLVNWLDIEIDAFEILISKNDKQPLPKINEERLKEIMLCAKNFILAYSN